MNRLRIGIESLGLEGSEDKIVKLEKFLSEIELWNPRYKLVAPGEDLIGRHILDCLAGVQMIRSLNPGNLADVGSGAGFPGIPLAIWMEDVKVHLIERSGRRAGFLRNVAVSLGLSNVSIIEAPVEEAIPGNAGADEGFDMITFRAWSAIDAKLLNSLGRILAPGGTVLAYKGRRSVIDAELSGIAHRIASCDIRQVHIPGLNEERNLVLLTLSCNR